MKYTQQKILIYYSIFNLGGAERSTSKLISKLLDKGFSVEVLLIANGGEFQNQIDTRAQVNWLRSGNFGVKYAESKGVLKFLYLLLYALTRIEEFLKGFVYKFKSYKTVIIGLHGLSPKFCLKNIKADRYIQFIRSDLKSCDTNHKAQNQIKKHSKFIDYYICVSETALDSFCELFPDLKEKGKKIYNLLQSEIIQEKSKEIIEERPWSKEYTNILTVCRIQEKSKGVFRMAKVLKELLQQGYKIKWYIIGEGMDFIEFQHYLIDNDMQNDMLLLGQKSNPYPYFKQADFVAVLSYYEGLCGVVNEAKILEKPLVATEFSGIKEQIENTVNGFIFENDFESIVEGMKKVLDSTSNLQATAINGMPNEIINDNYKVEQLTALF